MAEKTRARASASRAPPKAATGASAVNDLPPRDDLVTMYRDMLLIRRFEEKADSSTAWVRLVVSAIFTSVRRLSWSDFSPSASQAIPW